MKIQTNFNLDLEILKQQILQSQSIDIQGRTELDVRAESIRNLSNSSKRKKYELSLATELTNYILEMKSNHIVKYFNYIQHSNFAIKNIVFKVMILLKNTNINSFQKVEILRFVLKYDPENVDVDLIHQGLAEIKNSKPWLYVEILALKEPYRALDFISYLLKSGKFESNSFIKLFLNLIDSQDEFLARTIITNIYPLLKDDDSIEIVKYKLNEKGIILPNEDQTPRSQGITNVKLFLIQTEECSNFINSLSEQLKSNKTPCYAE